MSVNIFKNNALTKIAQGLKDSVVTITNNLLATKSGTALDAVQGKVLDDKITELNSSLTNENSETFNFGVKDGVRGFFTNPSRADDSFIPFNRVTLVKIQTWNLTGDGIYFKATLYYNDNTSKVLFDGTLKTYSTLTYNA